LTVFSDFWPFLWNFIIHTLFHLILRQAQCSEGYYNLVKEKRMPKTVTYETWLYPYPGRYE
jgi:hypothetical protein